MIARGWRAVASAPLLAGAVLTAGAELHGPALVLEDAEGRALDAARSSASKASGITLGLSA